MESIWLKIYIVLLQEVAQLEAVQQGPQEAAPVRRLRHHRRRDGHRKMRPGLTFNESHLLLVSVVTFESNSLVWP